MSIRVPQWSENRLSPTCREQTTDALSAKNICLPTVSLRYSDPANIRCDTPNQTASIRLTPQHLKSNITVKLGFQDFLFRFLKRPSRNSGMPKSIPRSANHSRTLHCLHESNS